MITYLPHSDFKQSLECLSDEHLVQTIQHAGHIILVIRGKINRQFYHGMIAFARHPAVLMWEPHLDTLKLYYNMGILIIKQRFKNQPFYIPLKLFQGILSISTPPWLGDKRLHQTHRHLLMISSKHYDKFRWTKTSYSDGLYWPS